MEQVGAAYGGPLHGLLVAPLGDALVVAAEQDLRDLEVTPLRRLGVDGVLQQAVLVGLLHQ